MIKLLLTIGIIVFVLLLWFGKGRGGGAAAGRKSGRRSPGPQAMVSCSHCGLHLPQPDAVEGEGGRHYCSNEHRRLGPAPGARP
jgi:uncharacterized protein